MEEFLQSCRQTLQEKTDQDSPGFHVVLGNEACDVDSMVSALAFAYLLFKTAGGDSLVLPLLNIRQSELVLRSDNVFLLRQTGLSPDLLLFRDQLDLRVLHRAGRLRLTLVDHNVLPRLTLQISSSLASLPSILLLLNCGCATRLPSDTDLEGAVVEVLDHHQLERKLSPTCPVTVEMVGSCATLVTERIIQKAPQILDQQLAQLLYGLNMEQMLLKDMKAVSGSLNVAVPVLYITLKEFLQRADLEAELSVFCQKSGFDLLLMMTISFTESKEPIRELVVFSHSASCREQVSKYLEQAHNPALNLSPISCPHPHISAYQQGNTLASRKKLLPLVKDFLRECDGDGCLRDTEEDSEVPPTPMNSLVDGCPLDEGLPRITAEDLQDKLHQMESADL
ncbi:exopolyphosphatase PRUNE1 isoform X5 [Girardinichthys multiradiatus]|uniref:exopolyphosphatase PRUNE1 isoform X5 n=1 Tax=Girardinichthys multiradiatus TaxID=208333 RepID=UPI001FAE5A7C|nr:exopolyphosphatase PRUNE1 isoform X5 [Girardinichthys multiradiatus]